MLPEAVKTYIHTHRQEAVDTLSKLIGFPSVATPQPQDGFPYGKPAAEALDFMLEQLSALGMTCTNYDYHMGAADWDDTLPPHLGILCHLDVVPVVQANWTSDPFTAEIRNDRIYGRGAIDDKGPAVAVLYALCAIKAAGIPLRKTSGSCWAAMRKTALPTSPIIWHMLPCRRRYSRRTAAIRSFIWKRVCSGWSSPSRPQIPLSASPPALLPMLFRQMPL